MAVQTTPIPVEECSMVKALEVVGEHWSLMVLREAFYGVQRFEAMQQNLGVARNILTSRLAHLVEHSILERVPYQEPAQRTRYEYRLTRKGSDLLPALIALMQWGDQYDPNPKGRPLMLRHQKTGQEVQAKLVREDGEVVEKMRELEPVFWPDLKKPSV